ncbi:MAG: response regulator [bacterium]|nr:response regulator [bacterium]
MKILIIDDSLTQSNVIKKIIEKSKFEIQSMIATDAFEGYVYLQTHRTFDAIVLDYEMPFADGSAFVKKVRSLEAFANIPIIISSARVLNLDELDVSWQLVKPYTTKSFEDCLDSILQISTGK